MKKLAKIQGVKVLNKSERKKVSGGRAPLCEWPLEAMYNPVTHTWSCC